LVYDTKLFLKLRFNEQGAAMKVAASFLLAESVKTESVVILQRVKMCRDWYNLNCYQ